MFSNQQCKKGKTLWQWKHDNRIDKIDEEGVKKLREKKINLSNSQWKKSKFIIVFMEVEMHKSKGTLTIFLGNSHVRKFILTDQPPLFTRQFTCTTKKSHPES